METTIGNVSWLIFCSLASAIETIQREQHVGSLKAHPVNGIMKEIPLAWVAVVGSPGRTAAVVCTLPGWEVLWWELVEH